MIRNLIPLAAVAVLCAAGCGKKMVTVEVEVTQNGKPVQGATVTFIPATEGTGMSATGLTDKSGKAVLETTIPGPKGGKKTGVQAGEYKVTVVKVAAEAGDNLDPESPEYRKKMEEKQKAEEAAGGPTGPQNELPPKYATAKDTPLTAKVPSDSYKFEIK